MKLVPLKDLCKMYQPPTISTKEMNPNGQYVVYGANGPIGRYDKFNHEEPQLLVTCRGATCGAVNISEPFAWINGNAMVIQPKKDLSTLDYMKYAFLGGIDISSSITGSAQPQITRTTLEVIKVPLPSLEKQREIVKKLDSVFAEIEVGRNHLRQRAAHFTVLEAGLIDERLTRNLESLTKKPLKEITSKIGSGATPRGGEESYKSEGIALIRSLNVYDDGFRIRKLARIDDIQAKALSNVEVQVGDVLLNITGASIARTCLAPQEYLPARVNQHVSIIRPKPEIILGQYLHYVLRSKSTKNKLLGVGNSGGSTRQALTKVDLENTIIGFPSEIEDQRQTIDELNSLSEFLQTFKENLLKMESLYSALAISLLSSAFNDQVA